MLSFVVLNAKQSTLRFEHISIDQGLPFSNVKQIHQDSQGFLWFATDGGLIKYDGNKFEIYKHNPDDPYSLASNNISRIIESNYGDRDVLWIGLRSGGVCKFDVDTERFTWYSLDPYDPNSLKNGVVWSLCESHSDALWIGTFLGIDKLDYKTGQFTHLLGDTCVKAIHEDANGILWIGTFMYGLVKLNPETGEKLSYLHNPHDPTSISSSFVESIYETNLKGRRILWVGTRRGLNKFDPVMGEFIPFEPDPYNPISLKEISVYTIYKPTFGNADELWLTGGPLRIFNPETEQYMQVLHDPDDPYSINSSSVSSVCEDESGIVWIGSTQGINKLNRQRKPFRNYSYQPRDPSSLSSNSVSSIYQDKDGVLWVGTSKGLNKLDHESGQFIQFPPYPENGSRVSAIKEDSLGRLWLGTNRGVIQFDKDTGEFHQYEVEWDGAPQNYRENISSICVDNNNDLWFGASSAGGIHKYNLKSGCFTHYLRYWSVSDILNRSDILDRSLWLAGKSFGLLKMDKQTGHFINYSHHGRLPASLSDNGVYTLKQSSSGSIWLGTGSGLNNLIEGPVESDSSKILKFTHYSSGDEIQYRDGVGAFFNENSADIYWSSPQYSFIHFTEESGLPSNHVVGILEDDDSNLWLSTYNGLSRFNIQRKTFRNYYKSDGLPSNQFVPRSCYKNDRGELFFGTVKGLTSFFPDSIRDNSHIPDIVLTDFQMFHKSVPVDPVLAKDKSNGYYLPKKISRMAEIELSHHENVFGFEFAALDYHNPQKNQYAYRLEGFNKEWIYTDASNRTATYTNLDPGDYVFRVKGSNNDGLWNEEGVSLAITITPPWWKSTLAYLGYLLLIVATLTIFYRMRLARGRLLHQAEIDHLEAERYHEIDELKSRFFANISHEFRTPLTLILGPVGKMLTKLKGGEWDQDLNLMQRQAKRLLELVTQLLDLSKLEAGSMKVRVSRRNIIPLLKGLTLSFASMAERRQITLSFNSELEEIRVFVEKDALVKMLNNLLSNAFKFTQDGGDIQVRVRVNTASKLGSAGEIVIDITDSGIGIPQDRLDNIFDRFYQVSSGETREREGTGIGLALTRELVELHKGAIEVSSEEGVGTTFRIRLPLGSGHLSKDEIVETDEGQTEEAPEDQISFDEDNRPSTSQVIEDDSQPILLIVEDNVDVRSYVRSYLDQSYQCFEAVDGEDGLDQALKLIPDLIISDVMMPKMDGVEFCRRIKSAESICHIPVILLTAKADLESKLEGLETGADGYLTKPFEAEELLVRIKNLIMQRELLRKQFRQDINLVPAGLKLSSMDEQFLEKATGIIRDHFNDENFNVDLFAQQIFMSRQHLNRKLKALTGRSALDFVRSIRLKSAAQLLSKRQATVTEIAYEVGFSNPSHFTKSFQKEFGKTPSAFLAEQKTGD